MKDPKKKYFSETSSSEFSETSSPNYSETSSLDFPDLSLFLSEKDEVFSSPEGLIAIGGKMDPATLIAAYERGIFPWPHEGYPWLWFSPPDRGILNFSDLHISKSLKKFRKNHSHWSFTINSCFSTVMKECQMQMRPGQGGTWIFDEMIPTYTELSKQGKAMSIEIWSPGASQKDSKNLVGGIYGVLSSKYFSAESMFFKKSNASKLALWILIEELQKQGHTWMDVQMVTSVTKSFGSKLVPRKEFLKLISY